LPVRVLYKIDRKKIKGIRYKYKFQYKSGKYTYSGPDTDLDYTVKAVLEYEKIKHKQLRFHKNHITKLRMKYDFVGKKKEGMIRVKRGAFKNEKCGFLNSRGKEVVPLIYANVRDFHEGMARVKGGNWASNKWGYINMNGDLIFPCIFEKPGDFSCGLAKVKYKGVWCFINRFGDIVLTLKNYNVVSKFTDGYAKVGIADSNEDWGFRYGVIDLQGNEVVPINRSFYWRHGSNLSHLKISVEKYFRDKK
jgi:hypothetical protein